MTCNLATKAVALTGRGAVCLPVVHRFPWWKHQQPWTTESGRLLLHLFNYLFICSECASCTLQSIWVQNSVPGILVYLSAQEGTCMNCTFQAALIYLFTFFPMLQQVDGLAVKNVDIVPCSPEGGALTCDVRAHSGESESVHEYSGA